jgi:hypothetical protein
MHISMIRKYSKFSSDRQTIFTCTDKCTLMFSLRYPFSYLSYKAPPSYNAFRQIKASTTCTSPNITNYSTENGHTYVLVIADDQVPLGTQIQYSSTCTTGTCLPGQYLDQGIGVCLDCPEGTVSAAGSDSLSSCTSCLVDGLEPVGKRSKDCKVSSSAKPAMNNGTSWRFLVPKEHTVSESVTVSDIELYSSDDCSSSTRINTTGGIAFSTNSTTATTTSAQAAVAFDGKNATSSSRLAGKFDSRDLFFVGITLNRAVTVSCIVYKQQTLMIKELRVQAKLETEESWRNVWIARYIPNVTNVIPFGVVPTRAPTAMPTMPSRTNAPTKSPVINAPMISPVLTSPTRTSPGTPTETVDDVCSSPENICRAGLFRFFKRGETMHRKLLGICTERCSTFTIFRGFLSLLGWKCGQCP